MRSKEQSEIKKQKISKKKEKRKINKQKFQYNLRNALHPEIHFSLTSLRQLYVSDLYQSIGKAVLRRVNLTAFLLRQEQQFRVGVVINVLERCINHNFQIKFTIKTVYIKVCKILVRNVLSERTASNESYFSCEEVIHLVHAQNFAGNYYFLPFDAHAYMCVSGGKKC